MARVAQQIRRIYEMCAIALVAGRADLDGAAHAGFDVDLPVFAVGQAAELANVHPQTLRQYDRMGMVVPQRTSGGARRYSLRDIDQLNQAQHLSQDDGINITGIMRILALEKENRELKAQLEQLSKPAESKVFAANMDGDIVQVQRIRHMKHWRAQLKTEPRKLPAGPTYRSQEASDRDRQSTDVNGTPTSRAITLWHAHEQPYR